MTRNRPRNRLVLMTSPGLGRTRHRNRRAFDRGANRIPPGPLPTPDDFAAYENVVPGRAERILALAERGMDLTEQHLHAETRKNDRIHEEAMSYLGRHLAPKPRTEDGVHLCCLDSGQERPPCCHRHHWFHDRWTCQLHFGFGRAGLSICQNQFWRSQTPLADGTSGCRATTPASGNPHAVSARFGEYQFLTMMSGWDQNRAVTGALGNLQHAVFHPARTVFQQPAG